MSEVGSASLTRREREVLALLCQGLADKEVAAQLSISCATVRTYVSRLEQKLGAENRAQLALLPRDLGILRTGPPDSRAVGQSGSPVSLRCR